MEKIVQHPLFKNRLAIVIGLGMILLRTWVGRPYWSDMLLASGLSILILTFLKEIRAGSIQYIKEIVKKRKGSKGEAPPDIKKVSEEPKKVSSLKKPPIFSSNDHLVKQTVETSKPRTPPTF